MKLNKSFIANIISVIGYISFIVLVLISSYKFYLSSDNNIWKFITDIIVFMNKLFSLKIFIFFIFMFIVEIFVKRFFSYTNFLQKTFSKKAYEIMLYTGIFFYLTGFFTNNFNLPLSFLNYSYFIIIFTLLLFLFISNPKLRINKYNTINCLVWSALLFQILLLLYVIIVLFFQNIYAVDGIRSLMIFLNYIILYGIFVIIFLAHIIAILFEIVLRKMKKITGYNVVNSNKFFRNIIYIFTTVISVFTAYLVYITISAFNNID